MGAVPPTRSDPAGTALSVRPREAVDLFPLHPEFLLGYNDLAITGALEYSHNQGVYLSPWWTLPPPLRAPVRGWKRAVLRRNPHGGADHWGHLFLLYHDKVGRAERATEARAYTRAPTGGALREIPLRVGHPVVTLLLRPTYDATRAALERFARDVVDRFRLLLD